MTKSTFFTFKANKNGKQAQKSSIKPLKQLKSEKNPVEPAPTHHANPRSQISTGSGPLQLLNQATDTASRVPYGTQVIELRDPVALARLVEQRMRKGGAKTEKWRLRAGVSKGEEKHESDDSAFVVPIGTMAVALKEPVPLFSFSEVAKAKTRGKEERVRVVARGGKVD